MCPVWVNGRFLDESANQKVAKWKPAADKEKSLWGICQCGEQICDGDAVGMRSDHELVVCYMCWMAGEIPNLHLDCAGLRLPGVTLSN